MFLSVLDMIFSGVSSVVSAYDVHLFSVGSVSVSFWELLLGLFIIGLIFGFFLVPRSGSVLQSAGNINRAKEKKERAERRQASRSNSSKQKGSG